jgi:hypothetical protein
MRGRALRCGAVVSFVTCAACNAILGNEDHLFPAAGPEGAASDGSGPGEGGGPVFDGPEEAMDATLDDTAPGDTGATAPTDGAGDDADGAQDGGLPETEEGGEGGEPPLPCSPASAVCIFGGIVSGGYAPFDDGGASPPLPPPASPSAPAVAILGDGFEFGEAVCDPTGQTCVAGGLTP